MKKASTRNAELTYDEKERLLHIRMLEGAELDLENTIEHYKVIEEITSGQKYFALIDSLEYFVMTTEALHYASMPEVVHQRMAAAHYRPSTGNRLTANFFSKTFKPELPVRVFETKEEATAWLASLDGKK